MIQNTYVELLNNPFWGTGEIMKYFGIGRTLATSVKNKARKQKNSKCPFSPTRVKRDAVLETQGINLQYELNMIMLINDKKGEKENDNKYNN